MSDEHTDRDALQDLTQKLTAIQGQLPPEEYANLVSSLSTCTDLLTSPPSQVSWLGSFQPGAQPADPVNQIKIGILPPPGALRTTTAMSDLLDSLAGLFAALARMAGPPSGPPDAEPRKIR
jgi:hypothetical protein